MGTKRGLSALVVSIIIGIIIGITATLLISSCGNPQTTGGVVKKVPEEEAAAEQQAAEQAPTAPEEPLQPEEIPAEQPVDAEEPKEEPKNIAFVEIRSLRFSPPDITIPPGTTVVWQHHDFWQKGMKHKITIYGVTNGVSPILYYGDSFNYTFREAGSHAYIDSIYKESMKGTITVE